MSIPHLTVENAPASRGQRRIALILMGASLVLFVALAPIAKVKLQALPAFIPAYQSALILLDLVTAALLLGSIGRPGHVLCSSWAVGSCSPRS